LETSTGTVKRLLRGADQAMGFPEVDCTEGTS
jgi:hypothetical protein